MTKRPALRSLGEPKIMMPWPCLNCGESLDGVTPINDTGNAAPGCITVCLYCGHIMAFDDNLMFRELTDEEVIEVAGDPVIIELQMLRSRYKR